MKYYTRTIKQMYSILYYMFIYYSIIYYTWKDLIVMDISKVVAAKIVEI